MQRSCSTALSAEACRPLPLGVHFRVRPQRDVSNKRTEYNLRQRFINPAKIAGLRSSIVPCTGTLVEPSFYSTRSFYEIRQNFVKMRHNRSHDFSWHFLIYVLNSHALCLSCDVRTTFWRKTNSTLVSSRPMRNRVFFLPDHK